MKVIGFIIGVLMIANGLFFLANGIIVGVLTDQPLAVPEIVKGVIIGGIGAGIFIFAYKTHKRGKIKAQ